MALNKYYTKEEIKRLRILMKDYPKETPKYIASKAIALGVCTDRTVGAVARQINKLKNMPLDPPKPKVVVAEAQPQAIPITFADVDPDSCYKADLYDSLLNTIFDNASLWTGAYEDGLFFDIPSLRKWIKEHEMDRFNAKIIELIDLPEKYGKHYSKIDYIRKG